MKDFIKTLEQKLIVSNATFEEFDKGLWFFLCSKKKTQLNALSRQLGIKGKYLSDSNIGNLRIEILTALKIDFML